MIVTSAEFVKSAVNPPDYPAGDLPEIAFAGRSNVGKSSLINTLLNRKKLVKISATPGRTQLLNFFAVNSAFTFVDLPGYGYAKVPDSIKKHWGKMIETYLETRRLLRGLVFILDIRRVPGETEIDFFNWLDLHGIPYIVVLTKTDKLPRSKQIKQHHGIAEVLDMRKEALILFSAKTRRGKEAVWSGIKGFLRIP